MSEEPSYHGGCHCGAIRFHVTGAITDAGICNCSICSKTGYVHWEVRPEQFHLETQERLIRNYRFGTGAASHYFCETCGISPFRRSRSDPSSIDINVRCLDGVDAEAVPTTLFDGRNWEEAAKQVAKAGSESR